MSNTAENKPVLPPGAMNKLVQANFIALSRRLADGKCLTASQLAWLEQYDRPAVASAEPDDEVERVASSQGELARALNVPRQTITWHSRRDGAPTSLDVGEWRRYLLGNANRQTVERIESGSSPMSSGPILRFDDGVNRLLGSIGRKLYEILKLEFDAACVRANPRQFDAVIFGAFMKFAGIANRIMTTHGFESVFIAPEAEDGEPAPHWEPVEITQVAARIAARKKPQRATD